MPDKLKQKRLSEIKLGSPVGGTLLQDFLGDSWETRIRTALELRKLEKEDPELLEATEQITTPSVAKEFQRQVKRYNIPKEQYKPLAKKIQEKQKSSAETVKAVRAERPKTPPQNGRDALLEEVEKMLNDLDELGRTYYNKLWWADQKLDALNVNELGGIKGALALETFTRILKQMKKFLGRFGYTVDPKQENLIGGGK